MKNPFKKETKTRFADFIYQHCAKSKRGKDYIRHYRNLARIVELFEKQLGIVVNTDSFDEKISEEFIHFLKGKGYKISTIKSFQQRTISMLNKANKAGYPAINSLSDISLKLDDSGAVYLSIEEIEKLNELRLNKDNAQVRDLFVIGCLTALRYSDYSRLSEDNFVKGNIEIATKKTGTRVVIPIHPIIAGMIERNKGYDFLRYKKTQQNFNVRIKTICKKAGFTEKIVIEQTVGFKKVKKSYKKYELISSHTARRSGATNMYMAGIPPFRIMMITGHKTESSFYLYIRIRKEENARTLSEHSYFK